MELTSDTFRAVMGHFATGVTVVTTLDADGEPHGITANALSSVSLVPPLVMVAVDRRRTISPALHRRGRWAVNVLAADQQVIAACFAISATDPARPSFCDARWRPGVHGMPILEGVIATLECTTETIVPVGDHELFIARVDALATSPGDAGPLLYFRRHNLGLAPDDVIAASGAAGDPVARR
jgi:3-hydroxy-9,10-secoandrosta-1,3,5(10)-triene-9,17-dione monooxygenase reductase component